MTQKWCIYVNDKPYKRHLDWEQAKKVAEQLQDCVTGLELASEAREGGEVEMR